MKNLLKTLIFISTISFSQSDNFLTKLFLDSVQISNQDFELKLAGVINLKAQKIESGTDNDDYYYDDDDVNYISEVLYLDDIRIAHQQESELQLSGGTMTDALRNKLKDQCSWNWSGYNPNIKMVSPNKIDLFPTFSFLKGKLLTITNNAASPRDYLFSVSKSTDYTNYGNKHLSFNLTDDDEKGYIINTIILDGNCFIHFSKKEMESLNFDTKFADNNQFSLLCDYETTGYNKYKYSDKTVNNIYNGYQVLSCQCSCEADYLSVFRERSYHMKEDYNLDQDDLIFLFKLVEKK